MPTLMAKPDTQVSFRANREVAMHVPDLAPAKNFYCNVLGFRLVAETADTLEIDAGELRLFVVHNPVGLMTYVPSIDVPDYEAARHHLEEAGCATVSAGAHSTNVYFRDPFGFVFDIVERPDGSIAP
ncbi:MAG TPA: VOC family protein [Gemmatimonadaceae bacterium]|nr:VOC family protein [Gemmatimonadaceae bacterium]